jgi:hypothetical protein
MQPIYQGMISWPVNDRAGNVRSNDLQLLEASEPPTGNLFLAN